MVDRRLIGPILALVIATLAVYLFVQSPLVYQLAPPDPDSYERVTVTAYDENGTRLAAVDVRVADTDAKRWLGLSATGNLSTGEGMLFVHESENDRSYVMRNMSFPIDIVFVGANESVTAVHHAAVPDGEYERSYAGRAKWVLEVPRGWANRTGVDVGDRIAVPPAAREPAA